MKIQVLFGSQSDERVYGPMCSALESLADVKMEVASAHRHPARVRDVMTTSDANVFIAGAGLAAHLPGVVASLTAKPVVGIAVNGAFGGLDAFMSVVQMPKDIPVMCVTENQVAALPAYLNKIKNWKAESTLKLYWNKAESENPLVKKALLDIAEKSQKKIEWVEASDPQCRGSLHLAGDNTVATGLSLWLIEKDQLQNPAKALDFFATAQKGGFWVGANNFVNFVLQIKKMELL